MRHQNIVGEHGLVLNLLSNSSKDLNLSKLIQQVDLTNKPLSLSTIRFLLENIVLSEEEVKSLASFDQNSYCRKRLFRNDGCEILILSWLNGQRSKIHDHLNSACGVKVLHGTALETRFETADSGHIYATESSLFNKGSVTVSQDNDIHQISNLQANNNTLITLHVYSPPLQKFNIYTLEKGKPDLLTLESESWFYEI